MVIAGTAGLGAAQQILGLLKSSGKSYSAGDIAIVEPNEWHHYQPGWTLVGSGLKRKAELRRPVSSLIPTPAIALHAEKLTTFTPDKNSVTTESGLELTYDALVVAPGLKIRFDAVEGLQQALADPGSGVSSIYSYDTCDKTWADIDATRQGKALFTQPAGVIKCAGAPQKVSSDWYMFDDALMLLCRSCTWHGTDGGRLVEETTSRSSSLLACRPCSVYQSKHGTTD